MSAAGYGGNYGGSYQLVLNVTETGVNTDGNYSSVHINAYMQRVSSSGGDIYNLDPTPWSVSVAGNNWSGSIVYGHLGAGGNVQMLSTDINVGHDGNGDASIGFSAYHDAQDSPYLTSASLSDSMWLSHINRYININSWSIVSVTQDSFTVNVQTSGTADLVDYQLNGGNWVNGYSGQFTNTNFTIPNLVQNTTYSVAIRVRNASGGLYTTSGVSAATTSEVLISKYTLGGLSDTALTMTVNTNYVCDQLQYQINNSGNWITITTGDFTKTTQSISGLTSNTNYSVTVRARHKESQTYTASQTKSATTSYPTPLQASNLTPSNGSAVSILTPTLSWTYTSTSSDTQGAYEVIVIDQATGTTVWNSGKVTSNATSVTVPSGLAFDKNYQWKVQTWSSQNIQGTYTNLALFKITHAPVVAITAPTAGQVVQNDTPTIAWSYSDAENTVQTGVSIDIYEIQAPGQTTGTNVFTTKSSTSQQTFTMPADIIKSGRRYLLKLSAFDGDNVQSNVASQEFTVTFIGPPMPNIDVELSEDILFAKVTVTTNSPTTDSYETDQLNVYKREQGTTTWSEIGTLNATSKYIEDYESLTGWTASPAGASVANNNNAKKGQYSLSLVNTSFGTSTYIHTATFGSIQGYDKVRVWIRVADITIFTSLEFRFGTDSSNYYSFTVNQIDVQENVWNSIEVPFNQLHIVGAPTFLNLAWDALVLVSNTPRMPNETYTSKYSNSQYSNADGSVAPLSTATSVTSGTILVDGLRFVSSADQSLLYDYDLANGKTYEYAATSFTSQEGLESSKEVSQDVISINYGEFKNTFLVPIGNETNSVVGFMTGDFMPSWSRKTDTQYYLPAGARTPVVYASSKQSYRTGSVELEFLDSKLNCKAIDAVHALEAIAIYKPILLRTWWGDNIYISIDGEIIPSLDGILGWKVDFNFTEIGNGTE